MPTSSRSRIIGASVSPTHGENLQNFIDVLSITQPEAIYQIHREYLQAGADIIETNTFGATRVSMADFSMTDHVRELNLAGVALARRAVDEMNLETPERRRFVAGSLGPTSKQLSVSGSVSDPAYRAVTFDQMVDNYYEQIDALVEGGVDLLLAETAFDTLVLKACLFAIEKYFDDHNLRLPVMASFTIFEGGRTLSAQTVEACWNSISHANLLSVGINCALGPDKLRPYIEELARVAPTYISCYPNAGLPNAFGGFDETPEMMAATLGEFARNGWLNIVGGCCGTTPAHIRAIAAAVADVPPGGVPARAADAPERAGAAGAAARQQFHHDRRAHERHRLEEIRPADSQRAIRASRGGRPRTGRKRGEHRRRQHGRRHARRCRGHDPISLI